MPAHITIRDGTPFWWDSTDIWVVPGADPNGSPGTPVAGSPAYLWAHVANTGNINASGTRVDFYWADPSGQIAVGAAHAIGSAFVDLDTNPAGQDVLCLVPWVPLIVNGGHECLLAVAHGAGDSNPIPDPLPNGYQFDPPAHDQIAQRNIEVADARRLAQAFVIAVHALPREDKVAELAVEYGGELDERHMTLLGLASMELRPAQGRPVRARLSLEPLCGGYAYSGQQDSAPGGQPPPQTAPADADEKVLAVSVAKTYSEDAAAGNAKVKAGKDDKRESAAHTGGKAQQSAPAHHEPAASEDDAGAAPVTGPMGGAAAGDEAGGDLMAEPLPTASPGNAGTGGDAGAACARLSVRVPRGTSSAVYLALDAGGLKEGEYQLLHLLERAKGKVLGGVSYVVIRARKGETQ